MRFDATFDLSKSLQLKQLS